MTSRRLELPSGCLPTGYAPPGKTSPAPAWLRVGAACLAFALAAALSSGATFTVTNTNDSGAGSLRQAILDANASPGITGGCGNNNHCPTDPATRGQMAVFVVKTFGLQ